MENLNQLPAGPRGVPPKPAGFKWTTLLWLLLTIVLVLWFVPSLLGQGGSANAQTVTYSAFVAQASADNVQSVTITDYSVTGAFKTPVPSSDGTTKSTQFTTTVPQFGNTDLIALLQAHQVSITVQSSGSASFWLELLLYVGPVLLLIGFFWWVS